MVWCWDSLARPIAVLGASLVVFLGSGLRTAQVSDATGTRVCHGCAPPVVICGQAVFMGGIGPGVATAKSFTRSGRYELPHELRVGSLPRVLELAPTCRVGVTVSFEPRGVLKLDSEARTQDGKIAAILVRTRRPGVVRIIVTRPRADRTIILIRVRQRPAASTRSTLPASFANRFARPSCRRGTGRSTVRPSISYLPSNHASSIARVKRMWRPTRRHGRCPCGPRRGPSSS
jgi:hypothetical protein